MFLSQEYIQVPVLGSSAGDTPPRRGGRLERPRDSAFGVCEATVAPARVGLSGGDSAGSLRGVLEELAENR